MISVCLTSLNLWKRGIHVVIKVTGQKYRDSHATMIITRIVIIHDLDLITLPINNQ